MTTEKEPTPALLEALAEVCEERGWTLVHGSAEQFSAERPGAPTTMVAAGSAAGLVRAIDSHVARELGNNPDHVALGPVIVTGVVGRQLDDLRNRDNEEKQEEEEEGT